MDEQTILWIAGTNWDSVSGTDKRLVEALPRDHHVLWVDPPVPAMDLRALKQLTSASRRLPERVSANVLRVRVPALPGVTRPGIRYVTAHLLERAIKQALKNIGTAPTTVVVAFPLARFPRGVQGRRILYATDDWIDGADLMGFSSAAVQSVLVSNLRRAHSVATVSEQIGNRLSYLSGLGSAVPSQGLPCPVFSVIPNGGPTPVAGTPSPREAIAGLVGQLNERLDLDLLEAVRNTGTQIAVIGPRAERDPAFRVRMDTFLSSPNVTWHGLLPPDEVADRIATFGVGMTPYTDTAFNRASFPLKTLEYLSAGVGVVSSDMPAARWLNTPHVKVGVTSADFARNVTQVLAERHDERANAARREFSKRHTWEARACDFLKLCATPAPAA